MGVVNGEDEGERDQRPHAGDLTEDGGLGIPFSAKSFDTSICCGDPLGERSDRRKQGVNSWLQFRRNRFSHLLVEDVSIAGGQSCAERLHRSSHVVDQEAAGTDQGFSSIDYLKVSVRLDRAVNDRTQESWIGPAEAGQVSASERSVLVIEAEMSFTFQGFARRLR